MSKAAPAPSSIWDDPEVVAAATQSGFVKFEKVDDSVSGTIASLSKHIWSDGTVAIKVEFTEPDCPTLTASQTLLKSALFQLKPGAGDELFVSLREISLQNGRTLKKFYVAVTRVDGQVDEIDQSDASTF